MTGQVGATDACGKFKTDGVNLGTKWMSDVMSVQEAWAKAVIAADTLAVTNATVLNPTNGRQNTYGAVSLGFAIPQQSWGASDPTVVAALNEWVKNLNGSFKARTKYTPTEIQQYSADLKAYAACIEEQMKGLVQQAEVEARDAQFFTNVTNGMKSLAGNLDKLFAALCQAPKPGVTEVNLDIPARQH